MTRFGARCINNGERNEPTMRVNFQTICTSSTQIIEPYLQVEVNLIQHVSAGSLFFNYVLVKNDGYLPCGFDILDSASWSDIFNPDEFEGEQVFGSI